MNYEELYEQYHPRISRYLTAIVGSSEADDLSQDVFLKVRSKLHQLKDPSKISSWLFKIALNTARDRFRQSSVENMKPNSNREDSKSNLETAPDTRSPSAEERVLRNEMIECFLGFVLKLPRNYFDVYVLSELEQLSDQEIADRLSLRLHTVKIRLHRARAKLYTELRAHCRCYQNDRGELMATRK